MKAFIVVYWLDSHVNTMTFTDESEAIERWKDLKPFMDTVRCFVTDEKTELREMAYVW